MISSRCCFGLLRKRCMALFLLGLATKTQTNKQNKKQNETNKKTKNKNNNNNSAVRISSRVCIGVTLRASLSGTSRRKDVVNQCLEFGSASHSARFGYAIVGAVVARFVTTARFVTKVTKRLKFDALPARFVTPAHFVTTW